MSASSFTPGRALQGSEPFPPASDPELLDARGLARRWSTSMRTIRRLIAGGGAPRPVRISARVIRWRLSEVRRWEAALEKANSRAAEAD
jgi:predicted DNA-binding transcriptional regulator AlpA